MKRSALIKLVDWKNSDSRKPLIVNGARKVGKTWLLKTFGEENYTNVAYISFYNNERAKRIFDNDFDMNRIILSLQLESNVNISPNNTLIILDEIQECPKALESLIYFCEDAPEYHVVAAGSSLLVQFLKGSSYPVGKVSTLELYPLSYKEFLHAIGEEQLSLALETKDYSIIDIFSDKYLFYLKNYLYIGGMPEVVDLFVKDRDYSAVRKLQSDMLKMYRDVFSNSSTNCDSSKINLIFDSIAAQLANKNKKFFFGKILQGSRRSEFEDAIDLLIKAGLLHKVSKVDEPLSPLLEYKDFSSYKLFFFDVGLLGAMCNLDAVTIIEENKIFKAFNGALTQQYVLLELKAVNNYSTFYFSTATARFNLDFLIQQNNKIVPIEVKAETKTNSQKLKAFFKKYNPEKSIRFSTLPYKDQGWMINYPLYAVCNI
ncbi:AAA family ATPase [Succinivibrio sp.]|uniref:ATP-binding protein n=1 Tax=Succinivibrio sp. TaxID=2053619 RepID=UPI00258F7138|nr:AAA family ATPase [Succinivibrio sp.]MDD6205842.1 AAA family ATPase [Succinivibrio sp.]